MRVVLGDAFGGLLDDMDRTVDALLAADPEGLDDAALHDAVVRLARHADRVSAARARLVARWERERGWADDGSRAAWARLARDTGCAPRAARAEVRRAQRLAEMPGTATALADGTLCADRADLLASAAAGRTEAFATEEATLVVTVRGLHYQGAVRYLAYWCQVVDDERGVDPTTRDRDGRHLHAARSFGGCVELAGRLDPLDGTIVLDELERLEHEMFDADWAEARARCGPDATADHLARTPAQRRADALAEMARRSAARPADARAARPLLTVLVGYETFAGRICELADGTVVDPRHVARILSEADIERVVFAGRSRVLDVGARHRLFTGATRRAVEVRDRHCTHPGCDVPASRCQVDHIVPWEHGGPTVQGNGRLRCPHHNRWAYDHEQHPRRARLERLRTRLANEFHDTG